MTVAAPIRPKQQSPRTRTHRAALPAYPLAAAEARRQVRAAVRYWHLDVDIDAAAVCTSELIANAVTHDGTVPGDTPRNPDNPGDPDAATVILAITASDGRLRVDVYDTSPCPPELRDRVPAWAETGRGLRLVDSLASGWGSYPTATGKAVYFTLDPAGG